MPKHELMRQCNGIEMLFVACDIRFAAGATFAQCPVAMAREHLLTAVSSSLAGQLSISQPEGKPPHLELAVGGHELHHVALPFDVACQADLLLQVLQAEVHGAVEASHSLRLLLLTQAGADVAWGFVVNANHALCDGRCMRKLVERALARSSEEVAPAAPRVQVVPPPWESLFCDSSLSANPSYLPLPGEAVTLAALELALGEISGTPQPSGDARVTFSCNQVASSKAKLQQAGGSLTGLWAACLQQAVGELYLSAPGITLAECCVSISVLVDLRPFLPSESPEVPEAFGTVTIAAVVRLLEGDLSSVLHLAAAMTADLKARVARGEAFRSAQALGSGNFEEGPPSATMELSNHGVYSISPQCGVFLTQRFDGYDGVSVALHSEEGSGALKVSASIGDQRKPGVSQLVLGRAFDLFRGVAEA